MARVEVEHVCKEYPSGVVAVRDFTLDVDDGEFLILAGPSGCGKSTLLRMIAGLEPVTGGELRIDGVRMNDVAPAKRDIAMVFQNYALYPHMTVYGNMAFALRNVGLPKADIDAAVHRASRLLDLDGLLGRRPAELSGGQRQRVAMGRAIVRQPRVFLMDEPLSNLDAQLRVQMRTVIARLHAELGATFIYVTHDQTEAMTLGTRIVVMKAGEIQQAGTPQDVYDAPANTFVAGFVGSPPMNMFGCRLHAGAGGMLEAQCGGFRIPLGAAQSERLVRAGLAGSLVRIGVRPENVRAVASDEQCGAGEAVVKATVSVVEPLGASTLVHGDVGRTQLASLGPAVAARRGDAVRFAIRLGALRFFDAESGRAIALQGDATAGSDPSGMTA